MLNVANKNTITGSVLCTLNNSMKAHIATTSNNNANDAFTFFMP